MPWLRSMAVTLVALLLAACTGSVSTTTTDWNGSSAPGSTSTSTTGTTASLVDWVPPDVCDSCSAEVVAVVPVGSEGVTYKHVGIPEAQPVGPAAMVVSESGSFFVLDTGGLGVVMVAPPAVRRWGLGWNGIQSLLDLALSNTGIRVLDVDAANFARVAEVDLEGALVRLIDLPSGLQLANGLSGIATGPDDELWVEIEGGARVAVLDLRDASVTRFDGYPFPNGLYGPHFDEPDRHSLTFRAGDVDIGIAVDEGHWVGARLLAVNPDLSIVVEVTDSYQDADHVLHADLSAHWYRRDGTLLGVSEIPFNDQFLFVAKPAAVGTDGYLYYMLTEPDDVKILRLPWTSPG